MKKVAYKEKSISEHPKRERRKLEKDSIKVVAGPGGQLFIADHHHGPDACVVQAVLSVLGSGLLASGCDDPRALFKNDSRG
jgi:hypothetical protein